MAKYIAWPFGKHLVTFTGKREENAPLIVPSGQMQDPPKKTSTTQMVSFCIYVVLAAPFIAGGVFFALCFAFLSVFFIPIAKVIMMLRAILIVQVLRAILFFTFTPEINDIYVCEDVSKCVFIVIPILRFQGKCFCIYLKHFMNTHILENYCWYVGCRKYILFFVLSWWNVNYSCKYACVPGNDPSVWLYRSSCFRLLAYKPNIFVCNWVSIHYTTEFLYWKCGLLSSVIQLMIQD